MHAPQVRCVGAPGLQLNGVDEISIQKCRCLRLAFRRGTPLLKNRRCNRRNADRNSLIVSYRSETKKVRRKRDMHMRYNPAAEICVHRLKRQYEWNLIERSGCSPQRLLHNTPYRSGCNPRVVLQDAPQHTIQAFIEITNATKVIETGSNGQGTLHMGKRWSSFGQDGEIQLLWH